MKKFKPFLLCLLVTAMILSLFSGCSNANTNTSSTSSAKKSSSNDPVELTYYVFGNDTEVQVFKDIISGFEKKYSNITVNLERSTGDYYGMLKTKFAGQNEPDMFLMESGEIAPFVKDDLLLPMDDYISSGTDLKLSDLWDVNDIYRYNGSEFGEGKLYALIKDWSPDYMMLYNKKQFDEANIPYPSATEPLSWDEFMTIAKKLTIRDASGNIKRYGTLMDTNPFKHLYEYVAMTGGSMFSSDFKSSNLTDSKIRPAFDYFVNLQSGDDAPAKYATGSSQSVGGDMFAQGNVSVLWMGRWGFYAYNLDKVNFDIGVAPPPVMNKGDKPLALSTGMVANSISANTDYPDEAYKFLEYFMTEGMDIVSNIGFNIPGNKTVASSKFLNVSDKNVNELNQYFVNAAQSYTQPVKYNPNISETRFETIMSKEFTLVYENKQTLDQALKNAQDQINDVIDLSLEK